MSIAEAVAASACFPPIFGPIKIKKDGRTIGHLTDGGVYDNTGMEPVWNSNKVVLISDAEGLEHAGDGCLATIEMPRVHPLIAPLVYAVPVQLLAYHTACVKGTDVDQPRNLAKSVTVE